MTTVVLPSSARSLVRILACLAAAPLLLVGGAPAQTSGSWQQQAPLPSGSEHLDVQMLSSLECWVAGSTGLMHTVDGGMTWSVDHRLSGNFLTSVFFADALHGWASGNGIFHTTDGGASWIQDSPYGTLYDLWFTDAQHGHGCGNGGVVYRTVDGGLHWTFQALPTSSGTLKNIMFVDPQHGWVVGANGSVFRTADAGVTWTAQNAGNTSAFFDGVWFNTLQDGWIVANGLFLHTTDGGLNWQPVAVPAGTSVHSISFADPLHGFAAGDGLDIVATTDGGATWITQSAGPGPYLWEVSSGDGLHAIAVGEAGTLLTTADGGANWVRRNSGTGYPTNRICSVDGDHAWAGSDSAEVQFTTDGGAHWQQTMVTGFSGAGSRIIDVAFADPLHGFCVGMEGLGAGDLGQIAATADGGRTWTLQFSQGGLFMSGIAVVDAQTAVAIGNSPHSGGITLRTVNGGGTWSPVPTAGGGYSIRSFGRHLWIAGSVIQHSADAGQTFSWLSQQPSFALDVSFADPLHGWAVGYGGNVMHTTDGGQTWTMQNQTATNTLNSVQAINTHCAWIAGLNGYVARTTDAGASWVAETTVPPNTIGVAGLAFLNEDHGWIGSFEGIWRRRPTTPLLLDVLSLQSGTTASWQVRSAGANAPVLVLLALGGAGRGPCFFNNALCLDVLAPYATLALGLADASGTFSVSAALQPGLPPLELSSQALGLPASATLPVKSNAVTLPIRP